jgi:hypothetical protein
MAITASTSHAELNEVLAPTRRSGMPPRVTEEQRLPVQRRWVAVLSARVDAVIEFSGGESSTDAVCGARRELAAENDELRVVLDAGEAGVPALVYAQRGEFRMLAQGLGWSHSRNQSKRPPTVAVPSGR